MTAPPNPSLPTVIPRTPQRGRGRPSRRNAPTEQATAQLRAEIAERYYVNGETQERIAAALGLSRPTVQYHLNWLNRQYVQRATTALEDARAVEVDELLYVSREARAAWERSKKAKEETISEEIQDLSGPPTDRDNPARPGEGLLRRRIRARAVKTERDGTPAFLEIILNANRERRRLLGLDAASESDRAAATQVGIFQTVQAEPGGAAWDENLRARIAALPPEQRGPYMDRLTSSLMDLVGLEQDLQSAIATDNAFEP